MLKHSRGPSPGYQDVQWSHAAARQITLWTRAAYLKVRGQMCETMRNWTLALL